MIGNDDVGGGGPDSFPVFDFRADKRNGQHGPGPDLRKRKSEIAGSAQKSRGNDGDRQDERGDDCPQIKPQNTDDVEKGAHRVNPHSDFGCAAAVLIDF